MSKLDPKWSDSVRVGNQEIHFESGRIARQADGSILIRQGDTVLLVTAVAASSPRPGFDFFPLTVEYRERFSAAGKFPGGYRKREGRIADHEILNCRLVDRTVRPLFPDGYRCEVQVIANVLSWDADGDPEALAITAGAAALHLSDIPFSGPVVGMRVVKTANGEIVTFPNAAEREDAQMDLLLSIGPNGLVMAEGEAKEVQEADVAAAIAKAGETAVPFFEMLGRAYETLGIQKRSHEAEPEDTELLNLVRERAVGPLRDALKVDGKHEKSAAIKAVVSLVQADLAETQPDRTGDISDAFHTVEKYELRRMAVEDNQRIDGRSPSDIRPIWSEVGPIPRVHGSALFTRGETQALVVATLGSNRDEQEIERLSGSTREHFQLYYSFPPYSVGETRPLRGPGRREIGHGNLARRAIEQVLPTKEDFAYTMKVESEITESNGSSSMASVCGGCLALMDAGVPIRRPVAGIAMGLISDGERTVVLSDILGSEDHLGDMDFKVAGSSEGITAIQLDNKLGALPPELLNKALSQAKEGRLHILSKMAEALGAPREELSPSAPRIETVQISTSRIRTLIGQGGRTIKELQAETGTTVDVNDEGVVRVFAQNLESLEDAVKRVKSLTGEPEVGKYYRGPVAGVKEFGAFVRLFEGIDGLVHVSEMADRRVNDPAEIVKQGDMVVVKVLGVDRGRVSLSMKAAIGVDESEIEGV